MSLWPRNKPLVQQQVHDALHYDAETGIFVWRVGRRGTARAGSRAGSLKSGGYRHLMLHGTRYEEHRLAWFYVHGVWPVGEVDHINRVKDDNRIANLREVTRSENQQNITLQSNNTSGYRGVIFSKRERRWIAQIGIHGKLKYLGSFNSPEVAYEAYKSAAAAVHTHNPLVEAV